jgi:hypothetical protein
MKNQLQLATKERKGRKAFPSDGLCSPCVLSWLKKSVALCLFTLSIQSVAANTNYYAQATATETNVFLGQVFNVDVVVKADEKPDVPNLDSIEGFNVTVLDAGKPTNQDNTWLYRFALRATADGNLSVPKMRFGSVATEPINVQAKKPEVTDRMTLSQMLSAQSVYVGEPALLKTTWDSTYQFGSIKAVDFHFPALNDKRFQIMEEFNPNKENQSGATGLPVHGTRVMAMRNSYQKEEVQHQSLTFNKILIPKKSGKIAVAPATLLCAADKEQDLKNAKNRRSAFQYPAYFDNTFFDQNVTGEKWKRIYTESQPLVLDVKPLPTEGRPDLFNGMVGDFSIEVSAEPTNVKVGEPITLTIKVTAQQFIENIFFPPLRYQPNLVNRFEIPTDRSLPKQEGKSKIYTQTIRALSTANNEVPPIQLSFFNPATTEYVTAESAAIPLTVSAAEEIGVYGGGIYQNRLRTVEDGIRHNYEHDGMLKKRSGPFFGWAHPFAVIVFLLIPPAIFGGISLASLFGEKRHHIHRTAKAARAFKIFKKNVHHIHSHGMKSEIYGDLDQVLRAYLGDRLHLIPGALSFRDAEVKLIEAGADKETLEELKHLFAVCESYRFTTKYNEQGDAKQIIRDATRIVRSVEKSLK